MTFGIAWQQLSGRIYRAIRAGNRSGFTLLEILVALAVLSVSMAMLLSSFSTSISYQSRAKREVEAAELAQSLLSRLGTDIPMQIGNVEGDNGQSYHWRITTTTYGRTAALGNNLPRALDISVSVSWGGGREDQSVTLRTLKLVPVSAVLVPVSAVP